MELSETDLANLRWMRKVNAGRNPIGFLYPTVRRLGALPELQPLVDAGYARLVTADHGARSGYWLLPAGRTALEEAEAAGKLRAWAAAS